MHLQEFIFRQKIKKAQTTTEYLLIVCLLAVALIPVTTILSKVVQEQIKVSARRIAGDPAESSAKRIAEQAESKTGRDLKDFYHQ